MRKPDKILVGDFETTVFKGQENTLVWASAVVELFTEQVEIFHSIEETYNYLKDLKQNILIYYHNLKFDGSFWLDFLLKKEKLKQALNPYLLENNQYKFIAEKYMENNSFRYAISDTGNWYSLTIKTGGHFIEIRDSLKLLPFSVEKIGKSFNTVHRKSSMKYEGLRYPGCVITDDEKHYIANDVFVIKEALEIMYTQGHDRMTIGSCCLAEYKKIMKTSLSFPEYKELFPNLYEISLSEDITGSTNADQFIRKSYRGGWCCYVPEKIGRVLGPGFTADVNSLYPSMMHSDSGNKYPVGYPNFWRGDIPEEALRSDRYYFVRIRTMFHVKHDKLPFIQIKNSFMYRGNENLTTSDIWDEENQCYVREWYDSDGVHHDTFRELTLTCTDFELLKEHYVLEGLEILGGCWFYAEIGIFDEYINKYAEIKKTSSGAVRELAKLFLNNLYGKLAASSDSSFKVAYIEDSKIKFRLQECHDKQPGFIAAGSAVTSYSRCFTIRAAQQNYHGPYKPGFVYADTDSIHCDMLPEYVQGIRTHPTDFNCWKLESYWDEGIFVRQKTYIEHITHSDGEPVDSYYNVKCAGLPEHCKKLFLYRLTGENYGIDLDDLDESEEKFLYDENRDIKPISLTDFKVGIVIPGKLKPTRIEGGVLLVKGPYKMH